MSSAAETATGRLGQPATLPGAETAGNGASDQSDRVARLQQAQPASAPAGRLALGHTRTCDCPPNHLNCLGPKDWLKPQLGVWQFAYERRDVRDKDLHPAAFPIALATRCIELFTHRGELVFDPFVGSSSTLVAARTSGALKSGRPRLTTGEEKRAAEEGFVVEAKPPS